jgi:hypothetical protein
MSTATLNVNDTKEAMLARIAELQAKVDAKEIKSDVRLTVAHPADEAKKIKASEGGSISVYGVGRFPVTLTVTQWLILQSKMEKVNALAKENITKCFFKTTEQFDAAQVALGLVKK